MPEFFKNNIQLLHEYDPALAVRLGNHVPKLTVMPVDAANGAKTLKVRVDNVDLFLHSQRDPQTEASRWAENVSLDSSYNILVFGCGLMHHVYELVKRCQAQLSSVAIVEENIDIVYSAFQTIDLSPYLLTKSTHFLIKPSDDELRKFLNDHITSYSLNGLSVVEHGPSTQLNPPFYANAKRVVREALQGGELLLRTKVKLGAMIQENIIRNFPAILSSPNVSVLHNAFAGRPGFIVGAGASLDDDIESLKSVGDPGVIICVDTAFKALVNHGIQPHLVVSTDPTYLNARHFTDVGDLGSSILAFTPSLYHQVTGQLAGTRVVLPSTSSKLLATLRDVLPASDDLPLGTNAGQTCFNLAEYMGCNPIMLVGLDFSFPKEGGATHFSGAALKRPIEASETPGKMRVQLISEEGEPEWEEFEPIFIPATNGGEVATNKFWLAYLRSMEERIHAAKARAINCSQSGAVIAGAERMPLSEAVAQFASGETGAPDAHNVLAMSIGFHFGDHYAQGLDVLNMSIEILKTAETQAALGQEQVKRLKSLLGAEPLDEAAIDEALKEIQRIHSETAQDQKLYVVLDEAADQVLAPFLKMQNRPSVRGGVIENAELSARRYENYFNGILLLSKRYRGIIEESVSKMQTGSDDFFSQM